MRRAQRTNTHPSSFILTGRFDFVPYAHAHFSKWSSSHPYDACITLLFLVFRHRISLPVLRLVRHDTSLPMTPFHNLVLKNLQPQFTFPTCINIDVIHSRRFVPTFDIWPARVPVRHYFQLGSAVGQSRDSTQATIDKPPSRLGCRPSLSIRFRSR